VVKQTAHHSSSTIIREICSSRSSSGPAMNDNRRHKTTNTRPA
jgi:hypothetical protein